MKNDKQQIETVGNKPGQIETDMTVKIHILDIMAAFPKSFVNFVPDGKMPRVSDGRLCIPGVKTVKVGE